MEDTGDIVQKLHARYPRMTSSIQKANCHQCTNVTVVFSCFPSSGCDVKYCLSCLKTHYQESILQILESASSWMCPFKRGVCNCSSCKPRDLRVVCLDRNEPIQSALDYNSLLIMQLDRNRGSMSSKDVEFCMAVLGENIRNLSRLARTNNSS